MTFWIFCWQFFSCFQSFFALYDFFCYHSASAETFDCSQCGCSCLTITNRNIYCPNYQPSKTGINDTAVLSSLRQVCMGPKNHANSMEGQVTPEKQSRGGSIDLVVGNCSTNSIFFRTVVFLTIHLSC